MSIILIRSIIINFTRNCTLICRIFPYIKLGIYIELDPMETIYKKGRIKVEKERDYDLFYIAIRDDLDVIDECVGFMQAELTEFINTINEYLNEVK